MDHFCYFCEKLIKDGDFVQYAGRSSYHKTQSKIIGAFETADFQIVPNSIVHVDCVRRMEGESFWCEECD